MFFLLANLAFTVSFGSLLCLVAYRTRMGKFDTFSKRILLVYLGGFLSKVF